MKVQVGFESIMAEQSQKKKFMNHLQFAYYDTQFWYTAIPSSWPDTAWPDMVIP